MDSTGHHHTKGPDRLFLQPPAVPAVLSIGTGAVTRTEVLNCVEEPVLQQAEVSLNKGS